MKDLSIEEKIDLFEIAEENVDKYEDNRLYSYASKVRALLNSIMTFEVTPQDPIKAIDRLENLLKKLEVKIKMRENYQLVLRQSKISDN